MEKIKSQAATPTTITKITTENDSNNEEYLPLTESTLSSMWTKRNKQVEKFRKTPRVVTVDRI